MKLLLIGCGNMGSALLGGAMKSKFLRPEEVFVFDKSEERMEEMCQKWGVQKGNPGDATVILLAVKPQHVASVFPLKHGNNPLLISVLAGISTKQLSDFSGIFSLCRAMPNTPALVSQGMTGVYFSPETSEIHRAFSRTLFSSCSEVLEVDTEEKIHGITAMSGSGPAYFFRFVESLVLAGKELGFSEIEATKIAQQTFFGSAELLKKSSDTPAELRKKVTSPGGTTEAALGVLSSEDIDALVKKAVTAASDRSKELGKGENA